jgi:hypothetical protein
MPPTPSQAYMHLCRVNSKGEELMVASASNRPARNVADTANNTSQDVQSKMQQSAADTLSEEEALDVDVEDEEPRASDQVGHVHSLPETCFGQACFACCLV